MYATAVNKKKDHKFEREQGRVYEGVWRRKRREEDMITLLISKKKGRKEGSSQGVCIPMQLQHSRG